MIEVKQGKDLSANELEVINRLRKQEFQSKYDILPRPDNRDWKNQFVFLKGEAGDLRALAKLEDIGLLFKEKPYQVKLFSTLIATEKNKGWGSKLLNWLKDYAMDNRILLIGFCETVLLPFYKKTYFSVLNPADNQFVYVDDSGEIIPGIVPGEVVYVDGANEFISNLFASSDKLVKIPRK